VPRRLTMQWKSKRYLKTIIAIVVLRHHSQRPILKPAVFLSEHSLEHMMAPRECLKLVKNALNLTSAQTLFNPTWYGDSTQHPEATSYHEAPPGSNLPRTLDFENRSRALFKRKKLRDASVSEADMDVLLPMPEGNTNYQLGYAAIDARTEVGLMRAMLQNAGAPASEINQALPLPDGNIGNYHLTMREISTRALWVRGRQQHRNGGCSESDLNKFLSLQA